MPSGNIHHLIIDGYSLLHRMPGAKPRLGSNLLLARQKLLRMVEPVCGLYAPLMTVVFDGRERSVDRSHDHEAVRIVFTEAGQTADQHIEKMVHDDGNPDGMLVVTSDRAEINTVLGAGGQVMSCGEFIDLCRRHDVELRRQVRTTRRPGQSLGDFFPE